MIFKRYKIHLKNKYWRDILYQASGNTLAQGLGIAGMPILTRIYSPDAFAIQGMFLQGVMLLSGFVMWRYEYFFQLLESDKQAEIMMAWVTRFGLRMCIALTILIAGIVYLSVVIGLKYNWLGYMCFLPISTFLLCLSVSVQGEAQRRECFAMSGYSDIAGKASYILSAVILSPFFSIFGLVATIAFSAIGKIVILRKYFSFPKRLSVTATVERHPKSIYRSRANGMVCSNLIISASGGVPIYFIGLKYGHDILGQFTLVMSTLFLPSSLLGNAIGSVFYQRAAFSWMKKQDVDSIVKQWRDTITKLVLIGLPMYLTLIFISRFVYPWFFGIQWRLAGEFASILAISAFFSFLAGPVDKISLVLGVSYYLPVLHSLRLLVLTVGVYFSWACNLSINNYIIIYMLSMSSIYLFDLLVGRLLIYRAKIKK